MSIVIWGSDQSGKTSLIAALIVEGNKGKIGVLAGDAETVSWRQKLFDEFVGANGRKREFPARTRPGDPQVIRRLKVTRPAADGWKSRILETLGLERVSGEITFLDASGEFFKNAEVLLGQKPRDAGAQGLVSQSAPVVEEIRAASAFLLTLPLHQSGTSDVATAFSTVLSALEVIGLLRKEHPMRVPVAVCITKADILDRQQISDPSTILQQFLGENALNVIRNHCEKHEFFLSSSVGWLPNGKGNYETKTQDEISTDPENRPDRPAQMPEPYGVAESILWLIRNSK
jgi:hypothetical protein